LVVVLEEEEGSDGGVLATHARSNKQQEQSELLVPAEAAHFGDEVCEGDGWLGRGLAAVLVCHSFSCYNTFHFIIKLTFHFIIEIILFPHKTPIAKTTPTTHPLTLPTLKSRSRSFCYHSYQKTPI